MSMKLKGKVAIVSGGARDIGRAVSVKLAADGAKVAVNYFNSREDADSTLKEIEAAGGEAILVKGDMTKQEDVDRLVAETTAAFGDSVDILVNVVGGLVARKTLQEMDAEFFDYLMRLNVTSTFMLTKATAPLMGEGSSIVNFASQAGRDGGGPGASAYASSKGAVMSFTRAMAKELGPSGIRVNSLCCGMISTLFHDTFTKDAVRANVASATALKRVGNAAEVADTVAFLASSESGYMSGVNLDVNGGLLFS
jgi:3-oxoacyl-[acyl-carrier protein] reductase